MLPIFFMWRSGLPTRHLCELFWPATVPALRRRRWPHVDHQPKDGASGKSAMDWGREVGSPTHLFHYFSFCHGRILEISRIHWIFCEAFVMWLCNIPTHGSLNTSIASFASGGSCDLGRLLPLHSWLVPSCRPTMPRMHRRSILSGLQWSGGLAWIFQLLQWPWINLQMPQHLWLLGQSLADLHRFTVLTCFDLPLRLPCFTICYQRSTTEIWFDVCLGSVLQGTGSLVLEVFLAHAQRAGTTVAWPAVRARLGCVRQKMVVHPASKRTPPMHPCASCRDISWHRHRANTYRCNERGHVPRWWHASRLLVYLSNLGTFE